MFSINRENNAIFIKAEADNGFEMVENEREIVIRLKKTAKKDRPVPTKSPVKHEFTNIGDALKDDEDDFGYSETTDERFLVGEDDFLNIGTIEDAFNKRKEESKTSEIGNKQTQSGKKQQTNNTSSKQSGNQGSSK